MKSAPSSVNLLVKDIHLQVIKARQQGKYVGTSHTGPLFIVICIAANLNSTVNLSDSDASFKLTKLLEKIKTLSLTIRTYKVLFLACNSGDLNFSCSVDSTNETYAKTLATGQLLAEGLRVTNYKRPIIVIIKNRVENAA